MVKAQNREFDCRVGDCKEDLDGETPLEFFYILVHNRRFYWYQRLFYLGKSSNLGERQFNHVLPESSVVAFFFFLSVTDTSLVQFLQGAHHTMSQRQVRMRRSRDLLTRKYGISFPAGFFTDESSDNQNVIHAVFYSGHFAGNQA